MQNPVLLVSPQQLLDLNKELTVDGAISGALTAAVLPRDRNIAGIDIDTVVTPFGSIGMMVIDPNASANKTLLLTLHSYNQYLQTLDMELCSYMTLTKMITQEYKNNLHEMGYDFGPPYTTV